MKHLKPYNTWINEEVTNEMLRVDLQKLYALKDKVAARIKDIRIVDTIEDIILVYQVDYGTDYTYIIDAIKTKLKNLHRPEELSVINDIDHEIEEDPELGLDPDLFD